MDKELKKPLMSEAAKGSLMQKLFAGGALIFLYVFFGIFGENFFSVNSLISILNSSYYIGFIAIGMVFIIISGHIDLSVGAVTVGSALLGGVAYNMWGFPIWLSLVFVILVGVTFGLINGLLVGRLRLPFFIATLGIQFIAVGFCSIVADVQTMYYPNVTGPDGWFKLVFFKTSSGFPVGALWLALYFIIAAVILNKTQFGRYVFALGGSEEASRLSGINVSNWRLVFYMFSGLSSGLAGIIYAATYSAITPQTGPGLEMMAIAACVIGGCSLTGGVGSLTGTIIGVFIIVVIKNGLMSMGLPSQWQLFFIGIVVIIAVLADVMRSKRRTNELSS